VIRIRKFEEDLGRWEAGEISAEELQHAYPASDVTEVLVQHLQMSLLTSDEAPDPSLSWPAISAAMQEPQGVFSKLGLWLRRPIVAGLTSVFITTSGAYALGVPPVERGVDFVREVIASVFGGEDDGGPSSWAPHEDGEGFARGNQERWNGNSEPKRDADDGLPGSVGEGADEDRGPSRERAEEESDERAERSEEEKEERAERSEEETERAEERREETNEAEAEAQEETAEAKEEAAEELAQRDEEADEVEDATDDAQDDAEDAAEDREDAAEEEADDDRDD
jgi:hypothetical protein